MVNITIKDLARHISDGVQILDTRSVENISSGFLSGSIFLYPDDNFPFYLKHFFDTKAPLIIVQDHAQKDSISEMPDITGLVIIGVIEFDKVKFDQAGLDIDMIIDIDSDEFAMDLSFDSLAVPVDLRSSEQFQLNHIKGSVSLPLAEMADVAEIAGLDEEGTVYFYSVKNTDAITAATLLKRHGLHNLRVVNGGWEEIQKTKSIDFEKVKRKTKS